MEEPDQSLFNWSVHGSVVVVQFKPFFNPENGRTHLAAVYLDPAKNFQVKMFAFIINVTYATELEQSLKLYYFVFSLKICGTLTWTLNRAIVLFLLPMPSSRSSRRNDLLWSRRSTLKPEFKASSSKQKNKPKNVSQSFTTKTGLSWPGRVTMDSEFLYSTSNRKVINFCHPISVISMSFKT